MQHRQEVAFTQQDGCLHEPPAEKGALARLWQEAWGIRLDHHCSSMQGTRAGRIADAELDIES